MIGDFSHMKIWDQITVSVLVNADLVTACKPSVAACVDITSYLLLICISTPPPSMLWPLWLRAWDRSCMQIRPISEPRWVFKRHQLTPNVSLIPRSAALRHIHIVYWSFHFCFFSVHFSWFSGHRICSTAPQWKSREKGWDICCVKGKTINPTFCVFDLITQIKII